MCRKVGLLKIVWLDFSVTPTSAADRDITSYNSIDNKQTSGVAAASSTQKMSSAHLLDFHHLLEHKLAKCVFFKLCNIPRQSLVHKPPSRIV